MYSNTFAVTLRPEAVSFFLGASSRLLKPHKTKHFLSVVFLVTEFTQFNLTSLRKRSVR